MKWLATEKFEMCANRCPPGITRRCCGACNRIENKIKQEKKENANNQTFGEL